MLQPQSLSKELAITPFLRLAFRPFFLLPALLSVISIITWLATLMGTYSWQGSIAVINWHGHEMVFGFAASVVVGFLLTAGQTWTGVRSINGWQLGAMVVLWVIARVSFTLEGKEALLLGLIAELSWWVVAISYLGYMIVKSGNHRNLIFIPLLGALAILDGAIIYNAINYNVLLAGHLTYTAVFMVTAVVTVLGGRVIPFFTSKALNLMPIKAKPLLESILIPCLLLTILGFLVSYWFNISTILSILFFIIGSCQLLRVSNWRTVKTRKTPLLWSLHLAYVFMGLGYLALSASYYFDNVSFSSALHLITVGTIGSMILSMMSRVSLGHTARALRSGVWVTISFLLILAASIIRFVFPLIGWQMEGYLIAGIGWVAAFSVFLVYYTPILLKARVDGQSG